MTKIDSDKVRTTDRANITMQFLVAAAILGYVFWCLYTLTHLELKDKNNSAFLIILGVILGWGGSLVKFSFPDSMGAAKTADTLNKLAAGSSSTTTTVTDPPVTTTVTEKTS